MRAWFRMVATMTGVGVLAVPALRAAGMHEWWSGFLVGALLLAGYIYGRYVDPDL